MTSKLSWVAFVPFTIAALAIKVIQVFFITDGTFYSIDNLTWTYIAVGCALAVFLFALIFCLCDRKSAPVYKIDKNPVAGTLGVLLAVALACDGANMAFNIFRTAQYDLFAVADAALTVLCAIVFVVLGLNHFVGNGGVRGLAVFYLIPVLFSALRLVTCFLSITTESIVQVDITKLICYVFVTLFMFNYAMIVALMQGKSPVKSSFIYGLPAVTILLSYTVYELCIRFAGTTSFVPSFFSMLEVVELGLLGLYILAFLVELTAKVKRKDEIEIIDDIDGEDYQDIDSADADIMSALENSANNGNDPNRPLNTALNANNPVSADDEVFISIAENSLNNSDVEEMYISDADASGFIYAADDAEYEIPVDIVDDVKNEINESADVFITKENSTYDKTEDYEDDIDTTMDRIDKLILEISEDEF